MKLTVKNIGAYPSQVRTVGGLKPIARGETVTAEFSDGEATNINDNTAMFEVEGYVKPKENPAAASVAAAKDTAADFDHLTKFKQSVGPIAERLKIGDSARFTPVVMDALDDGDKARQQLADIAALFGTDEVDSLNVQAAVQRLIEDHNALKAATEQPPEDTKPTDLAAAVALLDDANDEHWTQAGQPKIAALESIMGKDTSAADYAALPETAKRTRKTA